MKTSQFEERIALRVVPTAQERDERTQRELATFNIDLGRAWLVPPADCAGTRHPSGDGGGEYLRLAGSKPAKVLTGSASDPAAKPAIALTGSEPVLESKPAIALTGCLTAGRQSLCVPLQTVIESAVQAGLSAQRIYQDLICDHAFTGGYHSVQRFVRQMLQTQPVPFVRMEVEPGQGSAGGFWAGAWVLEKMANASGPHLFPDRPFPFPQRLQ